MIAEPVSTCVQLMWARSPLQTPRLRHEVVDPALAVLVAGVPVLDRRVLDGRVGLGHQLDHRGVQLVLVALRGGAALQVRNGRALFADDQCPLELPGVLRVDAEVGRQLHRALGASGDVDEGAVGEDRRVEAGPVVVGRRDHAAQVLLEQLGVVPGGVAHGAEDHAGLGQLVLKGGLDGDGIEDRVDGNFSRGAIFPFLLQRRRGRRGFGRAGVVDAQQRLRLGERDAELLVGLQQLGVDLVERAGNLLGAAQ